MWLDLHPNPSAHNRCAPTVKPLRIITRPLHALTTSIPERHKPKVHVAIGVTVASIGSWVARVGHDWLILEVLGFSIHAVGMAPIVEPAIHWFNRKQGPKA